MQNAVELVELISRAATAETNQQVPLRLFGSSAVRTLCKQGLRLLDACKRPIGDIDLVTYNSDFDAIRRGCTSLGLIESPDQNRRLMATGRLAFASPDRCLIEVSGDPIHFHHDIWLRDRLCKLPYTIPPTELLMTKLQFHPNFLKDTLKGEHSIVDVLALLTDFAPSSDDSGINVGVLHNAVQNFPLSSTMLDNLQTICGRLSGHRLSWVPEDLGRIALANCQKIIEVIALSPKSARWRLSSLTHSLFPFLPLGEEVDD